MIVPETLQMAVMNPMMHITSMTIRDFLMPEALMTRRFCRRKPRCIPTAMKQIRPTSSAYTMDTFFTSAATMHARKIKPRITDPPDTSNNSIAIYSTMELAICKLNCRRFSEKAGLCSSINKRQARAESLPVRPFPLPVPPWK